MPRYVEAGVADGLLVLAVGPAGAVGDHLPVGLALALGLSALLVRGGRLAHLMVLEPVAGEVRFLARRGGRVRVAGGCAYQADDERWVDRPDRRGEVRAFSPVGS